MQKVIKIIKRLNDDNYDEVFEKLELTILRDRKFRGEQSETYEIINGFLIIEEIFPMFLLKLEIYCQERFQKLN